MPYIYMSPDWPHFAWNAELVVPRLSATRYEQGLLLGRMKGLGYQLKNEATLAALTEETVKSSAIEGEELNPESVRSSLARRMGLEAAGTRPADRNVEGVVEMMLDATQHYATPLTEGRIFGWHAALFPTGYSAMRKIRTGAWREGPMEVVSGAEGKEKVHFEAPEAKQVQPEMKRFLAWYEDKNAVSELLIKTALAHLYFVTIHPLEDGNGRIARAITEMSLARLENSAQRFYSMSSQILDCLGRAIAKAKTLTAAVLEKDTFWRHLKEASVEVSERQKSIINMLLDGFEGKLTTEKWGKIAKTSHDTALRDIQDLIEKQILKQDKAGGRSTAYVLCRERDT